MARIARRLAILLPFVLVSVFVQATPAAAATGTWSTYSSSSPPYTCTSAFSQQDYLGDSYGSMQSCIVKNGLYYQGATLLQQPGIGTQVRNTWTRRYRATVNEGQWECLNKPLYPNQPRACFTATSSGSSGQYVQGWSQAYVVLGSYDTLLYPTSFSPSVVLS